MKQIILFLLIFIFLQNSSYACSCIEPSSFCESITDSEGNVYPEVILRGKIISGNSEGKLIDINQLIYGEIGQTEFILRPDFCTLNFNELEDDAEYIFALSQNNDKYYLIGCAIGFLKIENEIVKGKIAPGINQITYDQLSSLESCGNAFDQIGFKGNLVLFPNPTADIFRVKNTSTKKTIENLQLRIFNPNGKEIYKLKKTDGILPEEDWKINIQNLSSGVYLVQVSDIFHVVTYKIIKF